MHQCDDNKSTARQFARLWVKAQPVVAAYLFAAIQNRTDADDVLQDIVQAALEDFDSFDAGASFIGWVLGIARFRILNYYRSKRRERLVFGDQALLLLAQAHEQLEPGIQQHRDALKACLGQLPAKQRNMLNLRYGDDLDNHQIAGQMSMSTNAVAIALHRIRQALSRCIQLRIEKEAGHG
jgi:RNA polymerase sigma-70 factor (ECF subfamily)